MKLISSSWKLPLLSGPSFVYRLLHCDFAEQLLQVVLSGRLRGTVQVFVMEKIADKWITAVSTLDLTLTLLSWGQFDCKECYFISGFIAL